MCCSICCCNILGGGGTAVFVTVGNNFSVEVRCLQASMWTVDHVDEHWFTGETFFPLFHRCSGKYYDLIAFEKRLSLNDF